MLYSKKSSKYFANTWQKTKKKNLLKNLNYKQDTRFFLYLKRTKFFVYMSIIKS